MKTTYRILIVDDEENVRRMLATAFSLQGHETHCASDGKAALSLFSETQPDVVLMDIRMPEMDGIETAKRIMEMTDHTVPILFVTALCDRQTVTLCRNLDAAGYIVRPYKPVFVKTEIKRILMGRSEIE